MKEMPNHFLDSKDVKMNSRDVKTIEDFIYNITSELAKKTGEISFFISE
jgi:hypothetical protein